MNLIGSSILILGDGNFSFSLALSNIFPDKYLTATVYEEENEWRKKYDGFDTNVLDKILNKCINTKVFFKVDALNLKELSKKTKFSDIIFNFPHHGGKTNLRESRILLRKSVAGILSTSDPRSTRFHLTLAPGQSGIEILNTKSCFSSIPPIFKTDSWQPLELAAEFGLVAVNVEEFDLSKFPEYFSSGYKNTKIGFKNNGNSHTISFEWSGYFINAGAEKFSLEKAKLLRFNTCKTIDKCVFHQFLPVRKYHVSIIFGQSYEWQNIEKMDGLEKHIFSLIKKFAGLLLVDIFELANKRCVAPGNLHNRIYCLIYQGIELPLCRLLGNALHEELCSKLNRYFENEKFDLRIS